MELLTDLIHLYINEDLQLVFMVSPWIYLALAILGIVVAVRWHRLVRKRFDLVRINVNLGSIGSAELRPRIEDVEIAHKIWTELVTRKAAIPIDEDHDVIVEVHNSWYAMFGRIRLLVAELPAQLVRSDKATKELIRIAIDSLNLGLRPHLTEWQAKFRNWYAQQADQLETRTPQDVQRDFPEYEALMADLKKVNQDLIQYANELLKISQG